MADNLLKLAGRILVATLFAWTFYDHATHFSTVLPKIESLKLPFPGVLYAISLVALGIGSIGLALGYRTKNAATILIVWLAVVTYFFHFDPSSRAQTFVLLKNGAIMGSLLYIITSGPGSYSLK